MERSVSRVRLISKKNPTLNPLEPILPYEILVKWSKWPKND